MKKLTIKDHKILKGKLAGKTSKEIARDVGYKNPDTNGAVTVRQRLQKPTLQAALHKELARQGITLEKIVKPIAEALEASEPIYTKAGEYVGDKINHSVRLQASDRAAKYLGIDKANDSNGAGTLSPAEIEELASTSDEVTLSQLVFKRAN